MSKLLKPFLAGLIKTGSIEIETANGYKFTIGDGSGHKLGLPFNDMSAVFKLMADPELQFGELYMDGRIEVTKGTLFDVLMLSAANLWQPGGSRWLRLVEKMRGAVLAHAPQRPAAGKAQRRPSLRFRRRLLQKVPGLRATIFLRLFRA
jgi:hypothetical protein